MDLNAVNELKKLSENLSLQCSVVVGGTITANDFYEGKTNDVQHVIHF